MENKLMKNLRWNDYFLRYGDDFDQFWNYYLSEKEKNILFIVGLGFDPRMCIGVERILNAGGNGSRDCILLKFDEGEESPSQTYKERVLSNKKKLEGLFFDRGDIIEKSIDIFSSDGRRIGSTRAATLFSDKNELEGYSDIVVDISAIPRVLFFPIIKRLLYMYDSVDPSHNRFNLHVVVAEEPALDTEIQARGLEEKASYIHGFSGRGRIEQEATAEVPRIWIPILGEKRRVQFELIHTLVSPNEICPLLPFPASNPRIGDDLILEYRELLFDTLHIEPTNVIYAAEQNPFEVYRQIVRTVIQYNNSLIPLKKCKTVLSALSSKLLSIGALLAAYDLDQDVPIGIAHVETEGYQMPDEYDRGESEFQGEIFTLWLAGECYDE